LVNRGQFVYFVNLARIFVENKLFPWSWTKVAPKVSLSSKLGWTATWLRVLLLLPAVLVDATGWVGFSGFLGNARLDVGYRYVCLWMSLNLWFLIVCIMYLSWNWACNFVMACVTGGYICCMAPTVFVVCVGASICFVNCMCRICLC